MGVVFAREVAVSVVHVLAGVDVEVLLLAVSDLEWIVLDAVGVLSEEGSDDGVVVGGTVADECALGQEGNTVS